MENLNQLVIRAEQRDEAAIEQLRRLTQLPANRFLLARHPRLVNLVQGRCDTPIYESMLRVFLNLAEDETLMRELYLTPNLVDVFMACCEEHDVANVSNASFVASEVLAALLANFQNKEDFVRDGGVRQLVALIESNPSFHAQRLAWEILHSCVQEQSLDGSDEDFNGLLEAFFYVQGMVNALLCSQVAEYSIPILHDLSVSGCADELLDVPSLVDLLARVAGQEDDGYESPQIACETLAQVASDCPERALCYPQIISALVSTQRQVSRPLIYSLAQWQVE